MSDRNRTHASPGFSLVELMVALVISLILIAGVIKIYEGSKQAYRVQDNQARLQENGRFAMYFLSKDIRMAGYMGCGRLTTFTPNVIAGSPPMTPLFDPDTVIGGYDGGTWPAAFPAKPTNLVPGTDAILVRFASASSVSVTGNLSATDANIQIDSNPDGFQAGDLLFVTDCSHADVFRATSVSKGAGGIITIAHSMSQNTSNNLSALYTKGSQVMAFRYSLYYIGTTTTPGVDALYRVSGNSASGGGPEELVEGVQDMQLLYGLDTDGDGAANQYRTATQVDAITNGWQQVVSVRLNLLLESRENYLTQTPQQLRFNNTVYTAPDKHLYAAFGDTVTLRNRTF